MKPRHTRLPRHFRIAAILAAAFSLLAVAAAPAQQVEFNYNGRVKVQGQLFDGEGQFKFSLVDRTGQITYWANDGATLDNSEPTSSVLATVTQGFFSVNIGDAATTNMAPLDASLFNEKDRVNLRVWFSDGEHGFERLNPDRAVVNPALLGGQSFREIDIYVDPATGNDAYSGLQASRPKRTIQAAWDSLPRAIRRDVTVHLGEGVYREEVQLRGKSVVGDASVSVIGNDANPIAVRLTGAEPEAEATPVRDTGFYAAGQKSNNLLISGIQFEYFKRAALSLDRDAAATIRDCIFLNNQEAIRCLDSRIDCYDLVIRRETDFSLSQTRGITTGDQSVAYIWDCVLSNLWIGIRNNTSINRISGGTVQDCTKGFEGNQAACFYFMSGDSCIIRRNTVGIVASLLSSILEYVSPTFTENGTDVDLRSGSVRD